MLFNESNNVFRILVQVEGEEFFSLKKENRKDMNPGLDKNYT